VIVGANTNVFTLADRIDLNVETQYQIPVMLPADRLICLQSSTISGTPASLENKTFCNRADSYHDVTSINGVDYVVLGAGSYQERISGVYVQTAVAHPSSKLTLFK
jgi:hypothetical protein